MIASEPPTKKASSARDRDSPTFQQRTSSPLVPAVGCSARYVYPSALWRRHASILITEKKTVSGGRFETGAPSDSTASSIGKPSTARWLAPRTTDVCVIAVAVHCGISFQPGAACAKYCT